MEEKIMTTTEDSVEEIVKTTDTNSDIGTAVGMLIGSLVTAAVIAGGLKLKRMYCDYKTKKELAKMVVEDFEEEPVEENPNYENN